MEIKEGINNKSSRRPMDPGTGITRNGRKKNERIR